eukprot:TRINITY_DN26774_c0_g1_i1.p1 TRINITY_DN26774_c0_g1~~TRINITY_DN26774_c0_g1_i1.p1  ORF type:complete len:183 (+),score=73.62 TRINITY_DN26774_c0_g1_i1:67-615(+)
MVKKYSREADNPTKAAKAQGSHLRVHFKNTHETASAINGMTLARAKQFLDNVIHHKEAVVFRTFNGGVGRTAQAHHAKDTSVQARWPRKSVEHIQQLLRNAEANAEYKGLDIESLVVSHIQVNRAPKQRRRTYRAHGRINPFMSNPSHIELILSEKTREVPLPKDGRVVKRSNDKLRNGSQS